MKYKSLSVLLFAVVLTSCKMEEIQDNISVSGYWAQLNSSSQAKSFVRFDKGQFYTYSLSEALTVVDETVWGCDKDDFNQSETNRYWYSIDDGILQVYVNQGDNSGKSYGGISVNGNKLTLDGSEYVSVQSFNGEKYSKIKPELNRLSLSYAAESEAVSVKVTNPLPNADLKATTSTPWIRNLSYSGELLSFDVSEVQASATGEITLSYPGAGDVGLVVERSPGIRIVVDKQDLSYGYKSQSVSLGYRITGADASAGVSVEKETWNATWLKNLSVSEGFIYFELDENNTGETRAATIRLHTQYADDVSVTVRQLSSSTAISLTKSYENTDYTQKSLSFRFSIKDPQEGKSLEVKASESWITDISVNGNTLYYKVSENEGFLSRSGRIELTYGTLAATFTINQTADVVNLSSSSTANCYIVTNAGKYKFRPVKGNGSESVGDVSSCEILWETFGTKETPASNDLINEVLAADGYILFRTNVTYRKGNASIAAKDASGKILWSWHIWFTDYPKGQVYYNDAGTMMDRNLGAVSVTPGDIGASGLYYQWGRKDPFVGNLLSTIEWPAPQSSYNVTIDYVTEHPTTFVHYENIRYGYDWYMWASPDVAESRWMAKKTIYDPCPAGWRVPDGGTGGVWNKAWPIETYYLSASPSGIDFSGKLGKDSIWYPISGSIPGSSGSLYGLEPASDYWGSSYWSANYVNNGRAYYFYIGFWFDEKGVCRGEFYPVGITACADGCLVRCQKE